MSATTKELLKVAAEILGGSAPLARRLGIAETLLARFFEQGRPLPDPLLLRAVDVILEDRQHRYGAVGASAGGLSGVPDCPQNGGNGTRRTSGAES